MLRCWGRPARSPCSSQKFRIVLDFQHLQIQLVVLFYCYHIHVPTCNLGAHLYLSCFRCAIWTILCSLLPCMFMCMHMYVSGCMCKDVCVYVYVLVCVFMYIYICVGCSGWMRRGVVLCAAAWIPPSPVPTAGVNCLYYASSFVLSRRMPRIWVARVLAPTLALTVLTCAAPTTASTVGEGVRQENCVCVCVCCVSLFVCACVFV